MLLFWGKSKIHRYDYPRQLSKTDCVMCVLLNTMKRIYSNIHVITCISRKVDSIEFTVS